MLCLEQLHHVTGKGACEHAYTDLSVKVMYQIMVVNKYDTL